MGFFNILQSLFGNKSTHDMKLIQPIVESVKAAYPEIEALDNDSCVPAPKRFSVMYKTQLKMRKPK